MTTFILDRQMATKAEMAEHEHNLRPDLREVELRLDARIRETQLRLDARIRELELKLETKLAETKADLAIRVIGAGFLQTTIVVGVLLKVAKLI
jgi:hypothetical protein